MISEPLMNSKVNRENICNIMFEKFDVPGLFIAKQCVLSLIDNGKTIGYVVSLGHSITQFAPIFDGYVLPHSARLIKIGGKNITDNLINILSKNTTFDLNTNNSIANEIKEKYCYFAFDYEKEKNVCVKKYYSLPDENNIILNKERFMVPEFLFKPEMYPKILSVTNDGIHKICNDSIFSTEPEIRKDLYENICLSGGSTIFPGFRERLEKEMKSLVFYKYNVYISFQSYNCDTKRDVWNGGKILSSLSSFNSMWITKEEYKEYGSWIIHKI